MLKRNAKCSSFFQAADMRVGWVVSKTQYLVTRDSWSSLLFPKWKRRLRYHPSYGLECCCQHDRDGGPFKYTERRYEPLSARAAPAACSQCRYCDGSGSSRRICGCRSRRARPEHPWHWRPTFKIQVRLNLSQLSRWPPAGLGLNASLSLSECPAVGDSWRPESAPCTASVPRILAPAEARPRPGASRAWGLPIPEQPGVAASRLRLPRRAATVCSASASLSHCV